MPRKKQSKTRLEMPVVNLGDIKPQSSLERLGREAFKSDSPEFDVDLVSDLVGMTPVFIRKIVGNTKRLSRNELLKLLDLDVFSETFVPRSKILNFLTSYALVQQPDQMDVNRTNLELLRGHAIDVIQSIPPKSIQSVVTSTPYWGMRIYKESYIVQWADGEISAFGHEQTPEGFIRHSLEVLFHLKRTLRTDGSIWWNVMDTYNTRTQIRGNAKEALEAMQGKEEKSWGEYESRRYSAGHSFLLDGEQCLIPSRIAEGASRMGFFVKSMITWAKPSTLPEPQQSRVSRSLEYVIHLSLDRSPKFNKEVYLEYPVELGGRNTKYETEKLSDVWSLPTSAGRDGHGAQFPIALPARCIALTSNLGDLILDPFVGSGNSGVAAKKLGRKFIGIDVSNEYLDLAKQRIFGDIAEEDNSN